MIQNVTREIIWNGRQNSPTWFHPRAAKLPDGSVLMTCQDITGSDVFGQVHWSVTTDGGHHWSTPAPIASLARRDIEGGLQEGVCDVVPEYHAPSQTVLAMGHNVYYKDGVLTRPNDGRYCVYVVGDGNGNWSPRKKLQWDDPRAAAIYSCGCAQRVTCENGDVLIPLSYGPLNRADRAVTSVRAAFDGETLRILETGNELRLAVKRGLLEPSLAHYKNQVYMTIRAEDGRGYVSVAPDGLSWSAMTPWQFDDGELLEMSTTQQRWLVHSDGLFLVYTRKTPDNPGVMRWRAPLFVAQVDVENHCLIRSTEQIVLPLIGDGHAPGDIVARMGNFHVTNAAPDESWVTVGESMPNNNWRGDTLLARIRWEKPNAFAA
jgi:hypothetical protein